jgi:hypothetical protein
VSTPQGNEPAPPSAETGGDSLGPVKLSAVVGLSILVIAIAIITAFQDGISPLTIIPIAAGIELVILAGRQVYLSTALASFGLVLVAGFISVLAVIWIIGFAPLSYHIWSIPSVQPGECGTPAPTGAAAVLNYGQEPSVFAVKGTPGQWVVTAVLHPSTFTRDAGCVEPAVTRYALAFWLSGSYFGTARRRPHASTDAGNKATDNSD